MAAIQITSNGTLPESLSLVNFTFQPTANGGAYSQQIFIPRLGTVTDRFEYVLGTSGQIVAINVNSFDFGLYAITGLNIPLAQFQSNLTNVMPLITGGNDTVTGNIGNDFLVLGAGNDGLTLGAGDDRVRFDYGNGIDTIFDFGNGNDVIDFSATNMTLAALQANSVDTSQGVLMTLGSGSILLAGLTLSQIDWNADFAFA